MLFATVIFAAGFVSAVKAGHSLPCSEQAGSGCSSTCDELSRTYEKGQVLRQDTGDYDEFLTGYYAGQQQAARPECIFKPKNNTQGGGHGAFAGVSNVANGVTVSMEHLDEITLSDDLSTVRIGPANTWVDVYKVLEEHDLTVPGGRYPTVGVSGLALGGGESFFSSLLGWTCDSIKAYQVVVADGTTLDVDADTHADLFWALRGGGSNFGIVTRIDMEPMPLPTGKVWGGVRLHTEIQFDKLLNASYDLAVDESDSASKAGQIISFMKLDGAKVGVAILSHSEGEALEEPDVFGGFLDVPAVLDQARTRKLTSLVEELGSFEAGGDAELRARGTVTAKLTPEMLRAAMDICFEEFESVSDVQGASPTCVLQILRKSQLEATEARGGNAMGLSPDDGPMLLLNTQLSWPDAEDAAAVHQAVLRIIERAEAYADERGWGRDFRYMNYAGEFQDVISGYGEENKARLRKIAKAYDPEGVFQTLQPGYFKLDRPAIQKEDYLQG